MDVGVQCRDLKEIANFLGFAPQHLYYLVENPENYYTTIKIPKRSDPDQMRTIDIPFSELKGVQRAINKKILSQIPVSSNVHSYVSGRSILTATREFCPGLAVLKLDIAAFFPSITFSRVYGLFSSFNFTNAACFILARLCTKDGYLSQGAPTSPAISNIIVKELDRRFEILSSSWELRYLRYSDDLFFYKDKNFNHPRLEILAKNIVEQGGFKINKKKTKYYPKGLPRITLGLLTHGDFPRIPGPQRRNYRAAFFKASRNINWAHENKSRLKGMLEWYRCVHGKDDHYIQYRAVYDNISRLQIHDAYRSR